MNPALSADRTADRSADRDAARADFIERLGLKVEGTGWMPRMSGRVLGCVLVADAPMTQTELRDALGASVGAISAACRELLAKRLMQRVSIAGSRQAGMQLHPDAWRILEEDGLNDVREYSALATSGLDELGEADSPAAHNLQRMAEYFAFVEQRMKEVLEWHDATRQQR